MSPVRLQSSCPLKSIRRSGGGHGAWRFSPFPSRNSCSYEWEVWTVTRFLYGTGKVETKRLFAEYAKWGGFPETALAADPLDKTKLLKEYLRAMFFRDLVERYGMTNIALFDALADKLFSSFSTRLSLTAFYRQYKDLFPFSKDLLFQYFHNFEESMLIFAVRKFSESSYKRSRNPVKIYPGRYGIVPPRRFGRHGSHIGKYRFH